MGSTTQLYVKGQFGVPLTVYPWYLLRSLGILGDYIVPASDMHTLGMTLPSNLGSMSSLLKVLAIFGDFLCHVSFHSSFLP